MRDAEEGDVKACCDAVVGLHLRPFEQYGKRFAVPGPGRTRRWDLDNALRDEKHIDQCRVIARWHRMQPAERKWQFYLLAAAVSEAYFRQAVDELNAPKDKADQGFEVDGIVTRP